MLRTGDERAGRGGYRWYQDSRRAGAHSARGAVARGVSTLPALGPGHALQQIVALIHRALRETQTTPRGIGVSCGGPLDRELGLIQSPPNLPTWVDVPLKALLEAECGVACAVENDANAGAVAEHRYGAGRGTEHIVFLTLGTGVGAGLILNNSLFRGANGMAGELGHVRLSDTGPVGHAKAGSVEGWVSGGGLVQHAAAITRAALAAGEHTLLAQKLTQLTARDVGVAAQAGDAVAVRIVHATGARLGEALAVVVDLLNPERIVLGGLALRFGESFLETARVHLHLHALPSAAAACEVVLAQLGERIGDVAALCVAEGVP
jgi:glucokinase